MLGFPMNRDDLTTPLDGLASHDLPTINRPSHVRPRAEAGFTPGTIVGSRYRIVSLLGRGGMGEVYRADDLRLGQPVALKFVSLGNDKQSLQNLYHEVRVARQVSHPNVCRVHDVIETEGHRFIAMEYVDGEDLASLLRRVGRLPPAKATDIVREIASGLAAAHDRGIIHRDLKPANVMLDGAGHALVTDFGLAALVGAEDGRIAGTPAYMAPEQVLGRPVTPSSDVYALGLVMYELFTGEHVYASPSYAERRRQPTITPPPASHSVKDIDPATDAVITACLAEDPALRPASARAVLARLPGGDAIDAALAAGETPSPEMIAATAETGIVSARVAWSFAAVILIGLIAAAWQLTPSLVGLMRKPPEIFAEAAEEIVARAGMTEEPADTVHFFDHDRALLRLRWPHMSRAQFAAIRPGAMHFVYRRSQSRMAPRETIPVANDIFIFQGGRVTMTDPPLRNEGDALVVLDHHRDLVTYLAVPSDGATAASWTPLLQATGIDMSTLVSSVPQETPPVATDARIAWSATYPGSRERMRIEAASLRGRPAWLHVHPPWEAAKTGPKGARSLRVLLGVQLVLTLVITVVAIIVTRRILRRGRSDRAGALRLAFYVGGCLFLAWLVAGHHAFNAEDEARMLASGAGEAIASALIIWVFYTALEPGVRRTIPRALIGWTRFLGGNLRDPMVGREILFGIAGGVLAQELFWISASLQAHMGRATGFFANASTINPLGVFIGNHLIAHVQMIEFPIGTIFAYLMLRKLFGPIGGVVAFASFASAYAFMAPVISVTMLLFLFVLLRSGLLTGVVLGATLTILGNTPLTLDTDAWYWPRALAVILIVATSAAWAAKTASDHSVHAKLALRPGPE
jgi:hypothetical protein